MLLGVVALVTYFAVLPHVIFNIDARAFPGYMLVEFSDDCPGSRGGMLGRRIEYVVSASGYACSSTRLPGLYRLTFVFHDGRPSATRQPPALAEGEFFFLGALECRGRLRPYAAKELVAPGAEPETWRGFTKRTNFRCGVAPRDVVRRR